MTSKQPPREKPDSTEISDAALEKVTGGDGNNGATTTTTTSTSGNIGSQSTGAGAGKITFNPFSITRKID
jgi:hypothetical protein